MDKLDYYLLAQCSAIKNALWDVSKKDFGPKLSDIQFQALQALVTNHEIFDYKKFNSIYSNSIQSFASNLLYAYSKYYGKKNDTRIKLIFFMNSRGMINKYIKIIESYEQTYDESSRRILIACLLNYFIIIFIKKFWDDSGQSHAINLQKAHFKDLQDRESMKDIFGTNDIYEASLNMAAMPNVREEMELILEKIKKTSLGLERL